MDVNIECQLDLNDQEYLEENKNFTGYNNLNSSFYYFSYKSIFEQKGNASLSSKKGEG